MERARLLWKSITVRIVYFTLSQSSTATVGGWGTTFKQHLYCLLFLYVTWHLRMILAFHNVLWFVALSNLCCCIVHHRLCSNIHLQKFFRYVSHCFPPSACLQNVYGVLSCLQHAHWVSNSLPYAYWVSNCLQYVHWMSYCLQYIHWVSNCLRYAHWVSNYLHYVPFSKVR